MFEKKNVYEEIDHDPLIKLNNANRLDDPETLHGEDF